MKRDNHFLPKLYLRQWSSSPERVWVYRLLVSNESVPVWKECWLRGITKHEHLYTSALGGRESDEMESWLDRRFESPAASAIQRAVNDEQLSPLDWRRLVSFLAAQDVRTPSRFMEHATRWEKIMPGLLKKTLDDAVEHLETGGKRNMSIDLDALEHRLPLKVSKHIDPGSSIGTIKAEIVVGRETWLFGIRHLLSKTLAALHGHRWTIIRPAPGMAWITSDDPVIKLNYYDHGRYDFKGGWGSKGTEILFPLGPKHLLYARVGERPPKRGTTLSAEWTRAIRRIIAEHASRQILSCMPDAELESLRPRGVDPVAVANERAMWAGWHVRQAEAVAHQLTPDG